MTTPVVANAFDILMAPKPVPQNVPADLPERNNEVKLRNSIVHWIRDQGLGWKDMKVGGHFVRVLTDVLWYIDRNHSTLKDTGLESQSASRHFKTSTFQNVLSTRERAKTA